MTREVLNKIAAAKKLNLDYYDHILGFINESYTKVIITFANLEILPGGNRIYCNKKCVTFLVSALQKKEEFEWEYTTQGWERLEYIH